MGSFCSKTSSRVSIPRVINKNSTTPKIPQREAPPIPDVSNSKLDTKPPSSSEVSKETPASLSKQSRRGVVADIAQTAAGVAIGNVVGRKITNMFDEKNNRRDVQSTVEPIETDYSINNELKNEEITEGDNYESNGEGDESIENDYNDASEENNEPKDSE